MSDSHPGQPRSVVGPSAFASLRRIGSSLLPAPLVEKDFHSETLLFIDENRLGKAESGPGIGVAMIGDSWRRRTLLRRPEKKVGISIMIFSPTIREVTEL